MSGAQSKTAAGLGGPDRRRRRLALLAPFLVLALALAATVILAIDRSDEIDAIQKQYDAVAQSEFALELETATRHIDNELDRITEFIAGISAFLAESDQAAPAAVAGYVDATDARRQFPALLDALVASDPSPTTTRVDVIGADLVDLAPPLGSEPVLSNHLVDDTAVVAVTFAAQTSQGPSVLSLVFDEAAFLQRAMQPTTRVDSTLENTNLPFEPTADPTPPARTATPSGDRLVAITPIDVFGTAFELRSESTGDLLRTASRTRVWIILGAGAIAALAMYASLRSLVRSRATAWESAASADRKRAALAERFRASFDLAPIGMAEVDGDGVIIEANEALCRQVGRAHDAMVGVTLSSLVFESDRDAHSQRVQALLDGTVEANQGEHRYRHDDGRDVWVHESISVIRSEASNVRSLLVQSQDITAQRQAAWELAQQALHDDLTGLPNRALFLNRLKHALVRAERAESLVAVMFIDIDRFKVINDSLGHEIGDRLLVQIAERLGQAIRAGDTVARFGGDEFVVLCENVTGISEATAAAQRIQGALASPFDLGDGRSYASASIGITLGGSSETSADALLRDADAAMYRAKDQGRNRFEVFDHSMRSSILARLEIESQLRTALENGEIVMHYQAIVDPATHEPAGYEALIRWNHPEKGLLGPGAFLGVAEEAGLIDLIDTFALRSVCHQIAEWTAAHPAARGLYLTTNWSARNLARYVDQVEAMLAETGINPHQLVIEVTEGSLLEDGDASVLALQRLKQLGVQVAIDDFGTGYSSLAYLTQFAVDYLKIDRSFVSKLPDPASAAVIGAIADMATRLGIKLVAEGVETGEQVEILQGLGSPRMQGYRFAKPRPPEDVAQHLAERSGALAHVMRDAEMVLMGAAGN